MGRLKIGAAVLLLALATASGAGAHDDGKGHLLETLTPVVGGMSFSPFKDNASYVMGHTGFTGGHVVVEGDRLYVGSYGVGMKFFDISNPGAPAFIGEYTPGGARADSVPDAIDYGGRRFAVLNGTNRSSRSLPPDTRTDRSEFIDTTDAAHPVLLHSFIDSVDGEAHNGDIVDERKLWLASGGFPFHGGLRIYDLTPLLSTPASACRPDAADNPCKPVRIFRDDPVELWKRSPHYRPHPSGTEPVFTHTHDITVYTDYPVEGLGPRDIALLAEGGAYTNDAGNTGSVFVIDITDPRDPVVLFRWFHERGDGHHPIRYHHEAQFLEGDPRVMLVTDEDLHNGCNAGGVTAVRLSPDLRSATELSEWFIGTGMPAPVCSVHVFTSHGNLVFFGSYNAGLQVVDYSNPSAPRRVGHYIAEGATSWVAHYHEGYVYMGDMSRGLDVLRWHGPAPDLAVAASDIAFSPQTVRGDKEVGITATVHNVGRVRASDVEVRFSVDGSEVGTRTIPSIAAGASATASVTWSTKHRDGEHTATVTADPANGIDEESEANNEASRSFVVRGNRVRNGSFEESSSGSSPDSWSASGETGYTQSGTDGDRGVTAGRLGSWTSEPVPVSSGATYGVSAAVAGTGTLVLQQLSATGDVVATTSLAASGLGGAFESVTGSLATLPTAASLRVVLLGGIAGGGFDDVRIWEE
ncbi:MAG TPA: CARDB domain-containing protein [Gaiellaceae bacterium]